MRKTLSWVAGFALSFGFAFAVLLVYAVAQPSMWLPVLFAIAFYGILSLCPNVSPWLRFGISLIFAAGSCMLWIASGPAVSTAHTATFKVAYKSLLVTGGAIGLFISLLSFAKAGRVERPALMPMLCLMAFGWLISYFSSTHGGASPMVDWVMEHLGLSRHSAEVSIVVLRKTIHFSFYGLIAATGYLAALRNGAERSLCYRAAWFAALAYACFDEVRQSTQVDRGGSFFDVLLDMAGAAAAVLLIAALGKTKTGRRPKTARNSSTL